MLKNIYICHYTKLIDRKNHILQQFYAGNLGTNIEPEFILDYDQEVITEEIYNSNFDESANFKLTKNRFVPVNSPEMLKKLNRAELSIALKQKQALTRIVEHNSDIDDYYLILEDDVWFKKPISKILEHLVIMRENALNGDVIFFGEASLLKGNNQEFLIKKDHPATNGLCTYIIKKQSALKLLDDLNNEKISFPIDHEYNYRFHKLGFNVYWATPLTIHGSINGTFASTLR